MKVQRILILSLWLFAAAFASSSAWAIPPTSSERAPTWTFAGSNVSGGSLQAAYSAHLAWYVANYPPQSISDPGGCYEGNLGYANCGFRYRMGPTDGCVGEGCAVGTPSASASCAAGVLTWKPAGYNTCAGVLTCPADHDLVAGDCVPRKCLETKGDPIAESGYVTANGATKAPPSSMCESGCLFAFSGGGWISGSKDGKWFHTTLAQNLVGTGASCTGSPEGGGEGPPEPRPDPLPPGHCPGTVNGVAVTVPCETASANGPSTGAKPPENSPAPADGSDPANGPPGTKNDDTETTCTGERCVTTETTTTTNPDGSTTKEETETEETKDEFCVKNPASPLCEDKKSQFGGACGAFSCDGDAIQCAMVREQHTRNCQLFDTSSPMSDLGIASANGQARPSGHPANSAEVTAFALPSLISSAPLFGSNGSCPSDVTVGKWVIGFSKMCPSLNLLGAALEMFAYLIACFIVFRKGI